MRSFGPKIRLAESTIECRGKLAVLCAPGSLTLLEEPQPEPLGTRAFTVPCFEDTFFAQLTAC
jgi:hypothetical protein